MQRPTLATIKSEARCSAGPRAGLMTAWGQSLTNCSTRPMSGITREAATTAGAGLWV